MNEVLTFDRLPITVTQILDKVNRIEAILIKPSEPPKPQRFDFNGTLDYLNELGYTISSSRLQKLTASGGIPCRKFNNRLVFEKLELDSWVESKCEPVGRSEAALTLAKSANRKLKGGKLA